MHIFQEVYLNPSKHVFGKMYPNAENMKKE